MQAITVQFPRYGKHHMKIPYRQAFLQAGFYPSFTLCTLAFGAVPVAAAIVADADMSATVAGINVSTHCSRTAVGNGIKHPGMVLQRLMFLDKRITVPAHNLRQFIIWGQPC